jgi:hypothetical protein
MVEANPLAKRLNAHTECLRLGLEKPLEALAFYDAGQDRIDADVRGPLCLPTAESPFDGLRGPW